MQSVRVVLMHVQMVTAKRRSFLGNFWGIVGRASGVPFLVQLVVEGDHLLVRDQVLGLVIFRRKTHATFPSFVS